MAQPPRLLLDVNVLVALAWPHHPFHAIASRYMERCERWATCATTQLGFLRVSLTPAFTNVSIGPLIALDLLGAMLEDSRHSYLDTSPEPVRMGEAFKRVLGHRQVTDAYLIELATRHKARFLTLDAKLRSLPGVELLQ
ncbi:MAG: TA system VapC family ribonuclease toxin [Acidobacteriota bacterium]